MCVCVCVCVRERERERERQRKDSNENRGKGNKVTYIIRPQPSKTDTIFRNPSSANKNKIHQFLLNVYFKKIVLPFVTEINLCPQVSPLI